jgi:hypothetical protein
MKWSDRIRDVDEADDDSIKWAEDHSRRLKSAYEAGHRQALWEIIVVCSLSGTPIPEWACEVFTGIDPHVKWGMIESWNEVFGKPREKARSVIKAKNSRTSVYEMVQLLNARGNPINDAMFELIGKRLGIGGKTTVKNLYREAQEFFDEKPNKT